MDLKIKKLIQFDDESYSKMINQKQYRHVNWKYYIHPHINSPRYWRPRHIFYEIESINESTDKNIKYDIALIDGPHGNGRNISFLHLKNNLNPGAYIIVGDDIHAKDGVIFITILY